MILIFSESNDITTTKVAEWLNHFDIPYLRLDDNLSIDIIDLVTLSNNKPEIKFTYKNKQYSLDDFSIIWNRRGSFQFSIPSTTKLQQNLNVNSNAFSIHLFEESKTLRDYIAHKISDKFHIDDYRKYNSNKLIILDVATKVGLKIPNTYITNNFDNFVNNDCKLITKNIQDVVPFIDENCYLKQGTNQVETETLSDKNKFFYSLFQNLIQKKYEIRTFIFFEKLFSMAIFSQNNEKTQIDFRNYDTEKQNRMVPFALPLEIERKLILLMQKLNLQTGSIDLIFDGNDYIFLEVNPVGQLDFVSGYCNYQIEKYIAEFLKNKYYELKETN
jgi:ATP-GRASP peptide maturase of grasp-with-spasm system